MLVAGALLFWLAARPMLAREPLPLRRLLLMAAPVLAGAGVQAWLNYLRFDDLLDFGISSGTYSREMIASGKGVTNIWNIGWNAVYYYAAGLPPTDNPLQPPPPELSYPWVSAALQSRLMLTEFALGLFAVMPSLLLGLRRIRTPFAEPGHARLGLVFVSLPVALSVLAVSGEVYRYQLEAWMPLLLLLVPLAAKEALASDTVARLHWLSLVAFFPLTLMNTAWVVKTVCLGWGYC
jgi:hypothetical protein